ncbi:MAG: PilZ domain-containing protein [Candidatus Omnitrophota bacterium]
MTFFTQSPERREKPRVKCQSAIEYRTLNPDQFINDFLCDISEKGLSLLMHKGIPKDMPIIFQTKLAKNLPPISGKGKTVWAMQESDSKKYRIGIEITELNKESISRLSEFLQQNNEQSENQI